MNPLILYDNLLAKGLIESSAIANGYNIQNIIDYRPYTFAKFASAGNNYIELNLGNNFNVDSIGICGHNLNEVEATVVVQYYYNSWNTLDIHIPLTNNALMINFQQVTGNRFRILIQNTVGQPYIGVVFLGKALEMPYPPDAPRSSYKQNIISDTEISKSGYLLGVVTRYIQYEINHKFSMIPISFINNGYKDFINYASQLKPFFYAVDLEYEPEEVFYGYLNQNISIEFPKSILNYVDDINLSIIGVR